jgi:hypothetical protein
MKKYRIEIKAETIYDLEAENEEMALDKAFEYWAEYCPDYSIEEVEEDD